MTVSCSKTLPSFKEDSLVEPQGIKDTLSISNSLTDTDGLSVFQKVLLQANGTVTTTLEAYLSEPIQVIKLSESLSKVMLKLPKIGFDRAEQVIARKILLQGKISQRNCMYADSLILINNLDEKFGRELLETQKPIGKLWSERKVETFKEVIHYGREPAQALAHHFGIEPEEKLLFRTYCVFSKGKLTMVITEKFPERYFC